MKRPDKEIQAEIDKLQKMLDEGKGSFLHHIGDVMDILIRSLTMSEREIEGEIEDTIDGDYETYSVWDWVVWGRDNY